MKHLILDIDDGPSGQRCARLYGTTAASIHGDLLRTCLTVTPTPDWNLVPRLQHTDASTYQVTLDAATDPSRADGASKPGETPNVARVADGGMQA